MTTENVNSVAMAIRRTATTMGNMLARRGSGPIVFRKDGEEVDTGLKGIPITVLITKRRAYLSPECTIFFVNPTTNHTLESILTKLPEAAWYIADSLNWAISYDRSASLLEVRTARRAIKNLKRVIRTNFAGIQEYGV